MPRTIGKTKELTLKFDGCSVTVRHLRWGEAEDIALMARSEKTGLIDERKRCRESVLRALVSVDGFVDADGNEVGIDKAEQIIDDLFSGEIGALYSAAMLGHHRAEAELGNS